MIASLLAAAFLLTAPYTSPGNAATAPKFGVMDNLKVPTWERLAGLELLDIQAVYDPLAPERKNLVYYAGIDSITYRFFVQGMKTGPWGDLKATLVSTLTDAGGRERVTITDSVTQAPKYRFAPVRLSQTLGIPDDVPPGEYTFRTTVKDRLSHAKGEFSRTVRVRRPEFAVVRLWLYNSNDDARRPPPAMVFHVGESISCVLAVLRPTKWDPDDEVGLRTEVVDTDAPLLVGKSKENKVPAEQCRPPKDDGSSLDPRVLLLRAMTDRLRPGRFLVRCTITDYTTAKSIAFEFPLRIVP
jgi:hypothetical protein